MNCKPGDLAIVVRSYAGNEGRIVRCLRIAGREEIAYYNYMKVDPGAVWLVDTILNGTLSPLPLVDDIRLRPIRDQDGEDEMLRIVGKFQEVTA